MAVVQVITSLTSRDELLMHLLRLLYFYLALYSIRLRAVHVPGIHNIKADAISRNNMQVFFQHHPEASMTSTPIPTGLADLLGTDHQVWLSPVWRASLKASLLTV